MHITKEKARAYVIDLVNVDLILKGDVIRYPDHVALVHSDKPSSCSNSSTCTYEIIHAYGVTPYISPETPDVGVFSRKVMVTRENIAQPTGFGRIKLWD